MKLPLDAIIAEEKISRYLLQWRAENDKSRWLQQAGYVAEAPDLLASDIRRQLLTRECEFVETTEYGDKYRIRGSLTGRNGVQLEVVCIWMKERETGITKFVTLFPAKD